ncbi:MULTISPECIES: hypothetical protein [Bradyrhizobium]|uniref:hypothetical protein n=1 Tax=Bradyrhizobium TaxID=374 RepID=UPI0004BCDF2F|nr:hypothetical protein [Bradyrhizobium elkanii]WLA81140.1 hypothetical protein QNJ99_38135 [Bradyrhizobium elkanii]
MARKPNPDFGKRRPVVPAVPTPPRPDAPSKRSNHVALLLMGTLAVGGSAYALMPRPNCQPVPPGVTAPGVAAPVPPQPGVDCTARSSSSGGSGGSSRSSFYSSSSSSGSSSSSSSSVSRGGFGSFAHAFGFSGG